MRHSWRAYLAMYYPALAPVDRYWFASAPFMLANLQATWPQLAEPQRMMYRQAWSASLPAMLQFIDPVLRASHQQAPPQSVAHLVQSVRDQQQQASASPAMDPDLQAQKALYDYHVNSMTLQRFSTMAATNTIDLMHAMSGR